MCFTECHHVLMSRARCCPQSFGANCCIGQHLCCKALYTVVTFLTLHMQYTARACASVCCSNALLTAIPIIHNWLECVACIAVLCHLWEGAAAGFSTGSYTSGCPPTRFKGSPVVYPCRKQDGGNCSIRLRNNGRGADGSNCYG